MSTKTGWNSPICVCLVAATLALVGNIIATAIQTRSAERLAFERRQADFIMQATKASHPEQIRENVRFLINSGLLYDAHGLLSDRIFGLVNPPDKPSQFFNDPE